jgi:hypothetical protein
MCLRKIRKIVQDRRLVCESKAEFSFNLVHFPSCHSQLSSFLRHHFDGSEIRMGEAPGHMNHSRGENNKKKKKQKATSLKDSWTTFFQ